AAGHRLARGVGALVGLRAGVQYCRLTNPRGRPRTQVIRGVQPTLPGIQIHRAKLADGRRFDEQVARLTLVDVRAAVGSHVDQRALRQLPAGAIELADVLGDLLDVLDRAFAAFDLIADGRRPEVALLQILNEVMVDLQELAGERFALEQVRNLRL